MVWEDALQKYPPAKKLILLSPGEVGIQDALFLVENIPGSGVK